LFLEIHGKVVEFVLSGFGIHDTQKMYRRFFHLVFIAAADCCSDCGKLAAMEATVVYLSWRATVCYL